MSGARTGILEQAALERRPVEADISIVIPTLGRAILEECLFWIADARRWPAALFVVDQGRSEPAAAWVARLRSAGLDATHLPSDQRGRSAGINRGLERVATRFVTVTDDDCFVDASWLQGMVEHLRRRPDAIVTGRVDLAGSAEVEFSTVTSRTPREYDRPRLKAPHPLIGANMGVAMDHVRRIGPFDEHPSVATAEDNDWGFRALSAGVPIIYDPEIVVRHFHWRDAEQRAERYREYSRSQGGFLGKHLRSGNRLIVLQTTRAMIRGPLRWVRGVVRRDRDMADRGRGDTLGLLPGILAGLRRGRRS